MLLRLHSQLVNFELPFFFFFFCYFWKSYTGSDSSPPWYVPLKDTPQRTLQQPYPPWLGVGCPWSGLKAQEAVLTNLPTHQALPMPRFSQESLLLPYLLFSLLTSRLLCGVCLFRQTFRHFLSASPSLQEAVPHSG